MVSGTKNGILGPPQAEGFLGLGKKNGILGPPQAESFLGSGTKNGIFQKKRYFWPAAGGKYFCSAAPKMVYLNEIHLFLGTLKSIFLFFFSLGIWLFRLAISAILVDESI